jgi:hypothetical protein
MKLCTLQDPGNRTKDLEVGPDRQMDGQTGRFAGGIMIYQNQVPHQ